MGTKFFLYTPQFSIEVTKIFVDPKFTAPLEYQSSREIY